MSAPPHAIITGGSSGIGLALAKRLKGQGFALTLIARERKRLEAAKASLGGDGVLALSADVTTPANLKKAVRQAIAEFGAPRWAVASAGAVEPGSFAELGADAHARHMAVNYFGAVTFAKLVIPDMAANGGGHLVFVGSGAGLVGLYGYGAYGPSKFALRGLAETLRIELRPQGIKTMLAYPPDTDTPQSAGEARDRHPVTAQFARLAGRRSADQVAAAILRGARFNRFAVTPGLGLSLLYPWHGLVAPVLRGIQGRLLRRHLKHRKPDG